MDKINKILVQIDLNIRTVEGIEFDTRELANKAREEKAVMDSIIVKNAFITHGDYTSALAEIEMLDFDSPLKNVYVNRYTDKLQKFNKMLESAKNYEHKKKSNKKFTGFKNLISDVSTLLGGKGEENTWNEITKNGKYDLDFVSSESRSEPVSAEQIAKTTSLGGDVASRITNILSTVEDGLRRKLYTGDDIPSKKLTNAKQSYAANFGDTNPAERAYILFDTTTFGSAKTGFVLTNERLYYSTSETSKGYVNISEITSITGKMNTDDIDIDDDNALLAMDAGDMDTMIVQSGNSVREITSISAANGITKILQDVVNVLNDKAS